MVTGFSLNVSLPLNSAQITYTPFLCNASTVIEDPNGCIGAWQIINSSTTSLVSTTGPNLNQGSTSLIPQIFLNIRATALFLTTSPSSVALVNITVSTPRTAVSALFDSSLGSASILDLDNGEVTTVVLSYVDNADNANGGNGKGKIFDVDELVVLVPDESATTSFLPTATLPPIVSMPTHSTSSSFTSPSPSSTPQPIEASSNLNSRKIAQAVGLTVGLGLGLTACAVLGYLAWRWKKNSYGGRWRWKGRLTPPV
ncbi:hypothetical protein BDQ12DRAFT_704659 [Crucibulum laeve]|uniref:Mid2 domain-containing protein n=1 Tax=Crucibulum laeve TaxID=68775 RepID=A0A5C3M4X6_9AGAR|nr:hypothetical protein BDQ12DRAFT_704659 [Crucibulum laeve]